MSNCSGGQYQTCSSPRAVTSGMSIRHHPNPPLLHRLHTPHHPSHHTLLSLICLLVSRLLLLLLLSHPGSCLLYPRDSPSRQSKSLDGVRSFLQQHAAEVNQVHLSLPVWHCVWLGLLQVWNFKTTEDADQEKGFSETWFADALQDTINMPVPARFQLDFDLLWASTTSKMAD